MNVARLRDWLEVIGIFGVILSLAFVGLQIRLDREIALAATYQSRTASTVGAWMDRASSIEALRGELKSRGLNPDDPVPLDLFDAPGDGNQPTNLELRAAAYASNAEWFLWENTHFQYEQGFLPESHWSRIRDVIKWKMQNDSLTRFTWGTGRFTQAEFRVAVEEIIAEIETEES